MTPEQRDVKCPGCGFETMIWPDDGSVNVCPECGVDAIMPLDDANEVIGNRMDEGMNGRERGMVFGDAERILRIPANRIDSLSLSHSQGTEKKLAPAVEGLGGHRMTMSIDATFHDEAIIEAMERAIEDMHEETTRLHDYAGRIDTFEGP